jgi:hypothetical protein
VNGVKMSLFIVGALLAFSAPSHAAPLGGGFHGGSHSEFAGRSSGLAFRRGTNIRHSVGFRHGFAFNRSRRFFHRDHRFFFPQFVWPVYWDPYYYPYDYSYLDNGPDYDGQSWDNSAAPMQSESTGSSTERGPIVVILDKSNSLPMDSGPGGAYANSLYSPTNAAWQPKTITQDPNEKIGPRTDPAPYVPPPVSQPDQKTATRPQTTPKAQSGPFGNLVLVSWLEDAGKDVIYVQNTDTQDVQKITSEPNLDNFRIIELHPNADPKLFEAIISNGNQKGPVRFHF